jgi:hypothetical protein
MKKIAPTTTIILVFITLNLFLLISTDRIYAQPKPSFSVSYDYSPAQKFDKPTMASSELGTDSVSLADAEVEVKTLSAAVSYPLVFSEGKTVFINELSYQRLDFTYHNWPDGIGDTNPDQLHSLRYTLILRQVLSERWYMLALVTPGLASDLKADNITRDDFTFEAAAVFVRKFNDRWSLGFGAAVSNQFGEPIPLPVVAFEWNNGGKLRANGILPSSMEFWYLPSQRVELGLVVGGEGNRYHGDPEIHGVDNPQLRYSRVNFGPSAKIHLSKQVHLKIDGGIIGFHRSEFYDDDNKVAEYDLKPTGFIKVGITFGG